uniref:Maturase K n=1 Tax=Romanomermis culicivorax TaxID=13658 RepID=A0A915ILJ4_ROMCU
MSDLSKFSSKIDILQYFFDEKYGDPYDYHMYVDDYYAKNLRKLNIHISEQHVKLLSMPPIISIQDE